MHDVRDRRRASFLPFPRPFPRRPRDGLPPQVCKSRFGPDYRSAKVARKGSGYLLLPQPFPVLMFRAARRPAAAPRRRARSPTPPRAGWYFCWAAAVNCFSCYALYVAYDAMKVPCCLLLVLWHAAVVLTQIGDEADHAALHFKMLAGWCVALAAALLGAPSL